jgi:predicted MFS family arabinose efflux permease
MEVRRYGLILLSLSLVGWTISYIHRMMVPPLLPMIMEELKISNTQAGLLMSGFMISYAIAQIPAGYLSDKYGARKVVSIGMIAFSLATLLIGFSRNFEQFLALRVLFGLFAGTYYPPIVSAISGAFPEDKRGKAIGVFMSGTSIGTAIAPVLAVPIALLRGWRFAFIVLALPGFLIAAGFPFVLRNQTREAARGIVKRGFLSFKFLIACLVPFLGMATRMGFSTFLPLFLVNEKGLPIEIAAVFFSAIPAIGFFGTIFGGFIADKFDRGLTVSITTLTSAVLLASTYFFSNELILASLLLFGFVNSLVPAAILSLTSEIVPEDKRASAMAFQNTGTFIGASFGTGFGGYLVDKAGYSGLFTFLTINLLIGGVLALALKEKRVK